jgi:magnesium transporter
MIRTIQRAEETGVTWIDVTAPTSEELRTLATEHGLYAMAVEDCLDPWHLPKFERLEDTSFMILRVYGERPDRTGNTAQDMTRKIAVFVRGDTVMTIHRAAQPVCDLLERDHAHQHAGGERCSPACLLVSLAHRVLESYDRPLEAAEETLHQFEAQLFDRRTRSPGLAEIHELKGTVGTVRRLMWLSQQVFQKAVPSSERSAPLFQDLREAADSYLFYSDQLLEEAQNLMQMQLAVASQRTNEVMRLLTVFSAFFLPLTFIVGIYGMNFEYMPELGHPWGYFAVLALMAGVSLLIWLKFRRHGWLGGATGEEEP